MPECLSVSILLGKGAGCDPQRGTRARRVLTPLLGLRLLPSHPLAALFLCPGSDVLFDTPTSLGRKSPPPPANLWRGDKSQTLLSGVIES